MAIELPPITWAIPPSNYPEGWVVPSVGDIENFRRSRRLGAVPTHAEVLHRPAAAITAQSIALGGARRLVRRLRRVVAAEAGYGRLVAGYAAPQLGEDARAFLARLMGVDERIAMINPVVEGVGPHGEAISEGCFSCAGIGGPFTRPEWLEVSHYDADGVYHEPRRYRGYDARVVGHELDHLNGILVGDRIVEQGRPVHWVPAEVVRRRDAQGVNPYTTYVRHPEPKEPWPFEVPWRAIASIRYRPG